MFLRYVWAVTWKLLRQTRLRCFNSYFGNHRITAAVLLIGVSTMHGLQTFDWWCQPVDSRAPGAFLTAQELGGGVKFTHGICSRGGEGMLRNAPLGTESTTQGFYMSEAATRTSMAEKILGKGTFGKVTEVMCTMDGSRQAVELANHVVSRTCVYRLCFFCILGMFMIFVWQACLTCVRFVYRL